MEAILSQAKLILETFILLYCSLVFTHLGDNLDFMKCGKVWYVYHKDYHQLIAMLQVWHNTVIPLRSTRNKWSLVQGSDSFSIKTIKLEPN